MLFRNPRAFSFVLAAIGLGLVLYYGEQWYRLPQWSETEIEQSVELNLTMDLQRMGPHLRPSGEKLERLRSVVRQEVEAEIRHDRETLERWMGLGLILTVLGAGRFIVSAVNRR
jgi:hypothetical protein